MSETLTPAMQAVQQEMDALHAKNDELRRVLEWYAQQGNWKRPTKGRYWSNSPAALDKGGHARFVLLGLGDER